jgi:hypothetical protein
LSTSGGSAILGPAYHAIAAAIGCAPAPGTTVFYCTGSGVVKQPVVDLVCDRFADKGKIDLYREGMRPSFWKWQDTKQTTSITIRKENEP